MPLGLSSSLDCCRKWLLLHVPGICIGSIGNAVGLLVLAVTPAFRGRRGGAVAFALSALCCVDIGLLVTSLLRRCMLHWMRVCSGCDVVTLLFCCGEGLTESQRNYSNLERTLIDYLLLHCIETICLYHVYHVWIETGSSFPPLRRCLSFYLFQDVYSPKAPCRCD